MPASGASSTAKPRKKVKKRPEQSTRRSSYYDVSEEEELPDWKVYFVQRSFMIGRQLDLDGEVEYDSNGEG
jgi:hypothetical protein